MAFWTAGQPAARPGSMKPVARDQMETLQVTAHKKTHFCLSKNGIAQYIVSQKNLCDYNLNSNLVQLPYPGNLLNLKICNLSVRSFLLF